MANSDLKGQSFIIPEDIKSHLNSLIQSFGGNENAKGYQRLKGLVDAESISYEQMKRIKNYFDHANIDDPNESEEYRLNGGERMEKWVNDELDSERFQIHRNKQIRSDAGEKNQFKKEFSKGSKTLDREYLLDKIKMNEDVQRILKIMFR